MKKSILILTILSISILFSSCNKDDILEDTNNSKSVTEEPTSASKFVCTSGGFGLFQDQVYDCNYARGVKKYVEDYNQIIVDYNISECATLRVISSGNGSITSESYSINNSDEILDLMRTVYASTYNYCNSISIGNQSHPDEAWKQGYLTFWGSQPLSQNPEDDCNSSGPFGPTF